MVILFFSDLHGSSESLAGLARWVEHFRPRQLVLLGDLLYRGQNCLNSDYHPRELAKRLNVWKDKIIAVRGNCDREEDQQQLEFPMLAEYASIDLDGRKFFLSHGHLWHPGRLPPLGSGEVLAFGHTHIPQISHEGGVCYFNPGSIALPRGGFPPSFGWYQQQKLAILELATGRELFAYSLPQT